MSIKKPSSQNDKDQTPYTFDFLNAPALHHSYIISGGSFALAENLKKALSSRGKKSECLLFSYETLSKEDALLLREKAGVRAYQDTPRYIIVFAEAWTREAQNSLLKILEEPGPNTHFFLLASSGETLLSTIRSRSQIIDIEKDTQEKTLPLTEAKKFLASTYGERLAYVAQFLKEFEESETSGPRRKAATDFLSALEVLVRKEGIQKNKESLAMILSAKSHLTNQGALVKMILENMALQL